MLQQTADQTASGTDDDTHEIPVPQVPKRLIEAVDRSLVLLKQALAEMRSALAASAHGPGRDGQAAPVADGPGGRLRVVGSLELMWKKGTLNDAQFIAGTRYLADFERSQISPLRAGNYEPNVYLSNAGSRPADERALSATTVRGAKRVASAHVSVSDIKLDAITRLARAHKWVLAEAKCGHAEPERHIVLAIVEQVAAYDYTLLQVASTKRWGNRNAVAKRLKRGLDALAEHYGEHIPRQTSSGIRAAYTPDYRPGLVMPGDDELEQVDSIVASDGIRATKVSGGRVKKMPDYAPKVIELYVNHGLTVKSIGERFGVSSSYIWAVLVGSGIKLERRTEYAGVGNSVGFVGNSVGFATRTRPHIIDEDAA
jgi:hypothetical protein